MMQNIFQFSYTYIFISCFEILIYALSSVPEYGGHVFSPRDPREDGGPWVSAAVAGAELEGAECCREVELLARKCEAALEETRGSAASLEFILRNPGEWSLVTPGHQIMVEVKRCLVQTLGNTPGHTYDLLDPARIRAKVELCGELVALYAKFHPGLNYDVAMVHYEAANAICGLVARGDTSLVAAGLGHCQSVLDIVRVEVPGSFHDQLRQFMLGLQAGLQSIS